MCASTLALIPMASTRKNSHYKTGYYMPNKGGTMERAPNGRFAKRRNARIAKKSQAVLVCVCLVLAMGAVFSWTLM